MKRLLVCLLLAGCTQTYIPVPLEIDNQQAYQDDVLFCQTATAKYSPEFNGNSVVVGAVQGAGDNASYALLNPLMPLVGAAGGVVSSGTNSLDLLGKERINVFKNCLHDKTMQDKSAILANPN